MKIEIKNPFFSTDSFFVLAGDIGGTNTNLALIAYTKKKYITLLKTTTHTSEIKNFMLPLQETLTLIKENFPTLKINCCCISVAGPVKNNYCQLTNADWFVDGNQIQQTHNITTFVINDFIALSYGVPLLDTHNEENIIQLPLPDGTFPQPTGKNKAVIGAGTGLGVGFIPWIENSYRATPSEGGHFDFPAFDEETIDLMLFLRKQLGFHPGIERLVSGQGLIWIFEWLIEKEINPFDETTKKILSTENDKKPYHISQNAKTHPICAKAHQVFRKIYGKMAGNYATLFIPEGGLYIAGGIISKDEKHFLSDTIFMENFTINHKENISALLKTIPVYIVRDYSTSLLGAAVAGRALSQP